MSMFDDDGYDDQNAAAYDPDNPTLAVPRHLGNDWPKIRRLGNPVKYDYYQRASQVGKPLDDPFALHEWKMEGLARAMAERPDLREQALSVINPTIKSPPPPGVTDEAWKRECKEARGVLSAVVKEGLRHAGCDRRAGQGTALHRLFPRHLRGDDLGPIEPVFRDALAKMAELVAGFTIHYNELFVVWDDGDNDCEYTRCRAAGSLDAGVSPPPGHAMITPDGEVIDEHTILVADWKTGDGDVRKLNYGCQAPSYVLARPYDHTVTDAAAKDGDDGRRDWPSDIAPNQRWALLMHVPMASPEDAGWVWVDIERGKSWARAAQGMRSTWSNARAGAKEMFHAATLPTLLDSPSPAAGLATVTKLDLVTRIQRAPSIAALDALAADHKAEWTPAYADAAYRRWEQLQGQPVGAPS